MTDFRGIGGFFETCAGIYGAVSDLAMRRDYMSELQYFRESIAIERDRNTQLENEKCQYKRLSEQYFTILKSEGYFFNEKNELMKFEQEPDDYSDIEEDEELEDEEGDPEGADEVPSEDEVEEALHRLFCPKKRPRLKP